MQWLEYWRSVLKKYLSAVIFILFALQSLMDVLSFWLEHLGMSTMPTLLLRMMVLIFTALAGYIISYRRQYYWYLAAVCVGFFALHAFACYSAGYINIVSDLTNYVRVVQIPLFTLCFISFLRADSRAFRWVNIGFFITFAVITLVVFLSVITNTNPYTYWKTKIGIVGWFYFANSQTCILSMAAPILLSTAYRTKKVWILTAVTVLSCAQLYLLGTRLAYMAIFAAAAGCIFITAVCGHADKARYAVLAMTAIICLVTVKYSPMYRQQMTYFQVMGEKQGILTAMSEQREVSLSEPESEKELEPVKTETSETEADTDMDLMRQRNQIYIYYCSDMVQRFGVEKIMEKCSYTTDVSEMTAWRQMKIDFCSLLMDELPFSSRLFGIERARMEYKGESYDVENDFHGIYYLYGIVGLILFLAFLAYFLWLILWALVTDIRKYFTIDAGAYGISLLLALVNAYYTAGILRRPNASFYLSVVLAVIYYLVRIKEYPENEKTAKS